jgi:hypothetical protein
MLSLPAGGRVELEKLIAKNIPRDVLMACEDAYRDGDARGRATAANFATGHRSSAAGQNKHFLINETFHVALSAHGASPSALCGTRIVVGRLGIFNIARLNVPGHKWVNLRKSATRKKLAEANDIIAARYVQADLFNAGNTTPAAGTIFILGVMDGLDAFGIAQLTQVMIALPAPDLKSWLYIKDLSSFMNLYDVQSFTQQDTAIPVLKLKTKKLADGNDKRN